MKIWITLIQLLFAGTAIASPEMRTLSIAQAIDQALSSNPEVQKARERVEEARHGRALSISKFLPSLTANARALHRKDGVLIGTPAFGGEPYNLYDAGLELRQPLYLGGSNLSSFRRAAKEIEIRELDRQIAERDISLEVILAYYQVLVVRERVRTLRTLQDVAEDSLKVATRYQRIGRAKTLDLLQIRTQIAMQNSRIALAEAELRNAVSSLVTLLGDRTSPSVELRGVLSPRGLKELVARVKNEPYRVLEFERVNLLEAQLEDISSVELAKYKPRFEFIAGLGRGSYSRADLFNDYANSWNIGLQLQLPIFNGLGSIHEGRQRESLLRQSEIERVRVKDQVVLDETRATHELDAAEGVITSSEEALSLARDSVKEAQATYRVGTIDALQFMTVQQSLLDAQIARDRAQIDYITAVARFMIATGHSISELVNVLEEAT